MLKSYQSYNPFKWVSRIKEISFFILPNSDYFIYELVSFYIYFKLYGLFIYDSIIEKILLIQINSKSNDDLFTYYVKERYGIH